MPGAVTTLRPWPALCCASLVCQSRGKVMPVRPMCWNPRARGRREGTPPNDGRASETDMVPNKRNAKSKGRKRARQGRSYTNPYLHRGPPTSALGYNEKAINTWATPWLAVVGSRPQLEGSRGGHGPLCQRRLQRHGAHPSDHDGSMHMITTRVCTQEQTCVRKSSGNMGRPVTELAKRRRCPYQRRIRKELHGNCSRGVLRRMT